MGEPTAFAHDLDGGRRVQIGELQVCFPIHQKSSARGIRV
jgi:hypothetical protein